MTGVVPVPKSTRPGETSMLDTGAAVPTPVKLMLTAGELGSLLLIKKDPNTCPEEIGENFTASVRLCGVRLVSGTEALPTIVKGPEGSVIAEIIRLACPPLVIVIVLVADRSEERRGGKECRSSG